MAAAQDPPAYLRFPENEVAKGVDSFRASAARGGMVQVARDIRTCLGTMSQGAPADLVRQCFAFETAAFTVAMAHDARMRTAPLPGLSRAGFSRRLDGYSARMGVAVGDCPAARMSMSEQVSYRLGTSPAGLHRQYGYPAHFAWPCGGSGQRPPLGRRFAKAEPF